MPPIPVHIDEPITPSKARQDAATQEPAKTTSIDPSTTSAPTAQQPLYPATQTTGVTPPGPTPFSQQAPPPPTTTSAQSQYNPNPPPPQPGAVPRLPTQTSPPRANILPPPRAGEFSSPPRPFPAQMAIPPPTQNLAPTHTTDPTTPRRNPSITASRPQGYQQNTFAQEMSPAQRASLDQQEAEERRGSFFGNLPTLGSVGGNMSEGDHRAGDRERSPSVWDTVKGWAETAGNKAVEFENEAWRRVNGKS